MNWLVSRRPEIAKRGRRGAFTLAELLIVVGVIALLVAIMMPALKRAHRIAQQTQCMAQLGQLGVALEATYNQFRFYPLWDDRPGPIRYTWFDVLLQQTFMTTYRAGYCPEDALPDSLNEAHGRALGIYYPSNPARFGVDYSYGISATLSAGGWAWQPGHTFLRPNDQLPRRFERHEQDPSRRILAGDGNWSWIYNLNSQALISHIWNDPTQYDNTVAWRHAGYTANFLMQDGHVKRVSYDLSLRGSTDPLRQPVDTTQTYVWYSGEPLDLTPYHQYGQYYYPDTPPPNFKSTPQGAVMPDEMIPRFYTQKRSWSRVGHK